MVRLPRIVWAIRFKIPEHKRRDHHVDAFQDYLNPNYNVCDQLSDDLGTFGIFRLLYSIVLHCIFFGILFSCLVL